MVATLPMAFEYAKIQHQVNPELSGKSYFESLKHSFSSGQGKGIIFPCWKHFLSFKSIDSYKIFPALMAFEIPKVTSRFLVFQGLHNVIPNLVKIFHHNSSYFFRIWGWMCFLLVWAQDLLKELSSQLPKETCNKEFSLEFSNQTLIIWALFKLFRLLWKKKGWRISIEGSLLLPWEKDFIMVACSLCSIISINTSMSKIYKIMLFILL